MVAPAGTVASISVGETTVKLETLPLNVTDVTELNPTPLMATGVPTGPEAGENPLTDCVTVKSFGVMAVPAGVVTSIFPVVAPAGTLVRSQVSSTTLNWAGLPLKVTADAPARYVPRSLTDAPPLAMPLVGCDCASVGWPR